MDAMSDAIEGADVMLYGVSLRYKESANVSRIATRIACFSEILGAVSKWLTDCICAAVLVVSNGACWTCCPTWTCLSA